MLPQVVSPAMELPNDDQSTTEQPIISPDCQIPRCSQAQMSNDQAQPLMLNKTSISISTSTDDRAQELTRLYALRSSQAQISMQNPPQPQVRKLYGFPHALPPLSTSLDRQSEGDGLGTKGNPEILSLEPRILRYHNFLSRNECQYFKNIAKHQLTRSKVFDYNTGMFVETSSRTSTGMIVKRGSGQVSVNIEKRIEYYTAIPVEHGEGFRVLHYEVGQKLDPHHDYFLDTGILKNRNQNGGHRMVTVLMYLSDVEEGGETVFPYAKEGFLTVEPKLGDAIFFWNTKPDGTPNPLTLHGGCPVVKGDKWLCTTWLHVSEYKINASQNIC